MSPVAKEHQPQQLDWGVMMDHKYSARLDDGTAAGRYLESLDVVMEHGAGASAGQWLGSAAKIPAGVQDWTNSWTGGWRRSSICVGPDAARRCCSTRVVR